MLFAYINRDSVFRLKVHNLNALLLFEIAVYNFKWIKITLFNTFMSLANKFRKYKTQNRWKHE